MKYLFLIITLASCCANKSQTTKQYTLQIERDYLGCVTREIRTYKRDGFFNGVSFPKGTKVIINYPRPHIDMQ